MNAMNAANPAQIQGLDVRGPRFGAVLTTIVLAAVLVTGSGWPLAAQAAVFAVGAAAGMRRSPYGWLFATFVRPRLGPPAETEDPAPPRFAQAVGLAFALIGLTGYFAGPLWLGMAATGCALAAAFLNAAFGYCLGCEMYLLFRRATG
ncbi:DUF4395 domain-containing protein [Streptomyces sp. H10-C2]|uniref:DUF4395 domain-containing protein n=1 Tax=unclassified Streptomyces TaxID=2593676 RepID=UPI0024BABD02|nr:MULTISPECIES: DUF4395 domain-containing protein [unclassified Streptomyces]MDJ0342923.1 DUF4395 domain-containing protein [Streptomyces sp. PH10-H1]MDJ0372697.1 DUF4395 domain-containing protein [Streptomyces sp. H10-C2]